MRARRPAVRAANCRRARKGALGACAVGTGLAAWPARWDNGACCCGSAVDGNDLPSLRAGSGDASAAGSWRLASGGSSGAPRERPGGRAGSGCVPRAVPGRRPAPASLPPGDDGEGSGARARDGGVLFAEDRAEAGGGRGVPGSGGGEHAGSPDGVRVSAAAPFGLQAPVCGGGWPCAGDGGCPVRDAVGGRDEGSREREQAQGDEPRSDGAGGAASAGGDRCARGAGAGDGRGGGRPARGVGSGRRAAGGAAPPEGSAVGDPGGEGAAGGARPGGGRRPGPKAGSGAEPEGRPAVQPGVRGAEGVGAGQLHGSGQPDHEDLAGGLPAVLRRAGCGGGEEPAGGGHRGDVERQRPGTSGEAAGSGGGKPGGAA